MFLKHNLIEIFSLFLAIYRILLLFYDIIKRNLNKISDKNITIMGEDKTCNLMDLSDYSLLHIFKYLSSSDLYNLSSMCKRLESLAKEKNLWYRIDARAATSNTLDKVKYCLGKANEHTEHLLICGEGRDKKGLPADTFKECSYLNLTVLALENQLICKEPGKPKKQISLRERRSSNYKPIVLQPKLSDYPKGLVELSLRKTFVKNCEKFFKFSDTHMQNLKVLILDECAWVDTQMLVPISKYPKLEILSLYRCKKLSDSDIAYISLAGSYGFTNLRILDVRFTGLGDQILKTFYKHRTLQELYFQDYTTTYALDRAKRRLAIARGGAVKRPAYFSHYDDIPDFSPSRISELFKCYRLVRRNMQTVTDQGTASYNSLRPDLDAVRKVGSVLYRPPHADCTCGYIFGVGKTAMRNTQTSHAGDEGEEISKLKRIIEAEESSGKGRKFVCGLSHKSSYPISINGKTNLISDYQMAVFEHTALDFSDFGILKTESNQELSLERKTIDISDPELTLWDLYGNTDESNGGSTDKEDNPTYNSSSDVLDDSSVKNEDADRKPGCSKRKFSPDKEEKSGASSDTSDCESNSDIDDENGDDKAQGDRSTSPRQKKRRGNKRRRDNDGEQPQFKTFVLHCGGLNRGSSFSVDLEWLRSRHDLVPLNGVLNDAPQVVIRKLSLRGYPGITDHSLHFLSDLKLDLLDVTGTKVTRNGVTHFLLTNPQCRVLHECACTCPVDVHF